MSYTTTISNNDISVSLENNAYSVSLARIGGQGSQGNSISTVSINSDNELIVTIVNSAGTVVETINAGYVVAGFQLEEIANVTITNIQDGDYIAWNASTSKYENHTLTTTKLSDIDNTNKADGALLVYNGTTGKYTATNRIENAQTIITGGSF